MVIRNTLICIVALLIAPSSVAGETMRVHFIDVGQGDATLLEFPNAAVLIDTGGESNGGFDSAAALLDYLDEFFTRRPDLHETLVCLYLTHPHLDHTRGVEDVLAHYRVLHAVTNGQETGSGRYDQRDLHRAVSETESTPHTSDDIGFEAVELAEIGDAGFTNDVIDPVYGGAIDPAITMLWGALDSDPGWGTDGGDLHFDDENNHSLVIRVDFGTASVLLTGDLEEVAIEDLVEKYDGTDMLDADVHQAGHHGSRNGFHEDLLDVISPEIAVISMGPADREDWWTAWAYGHPNIDAVQALEHAVSGARDPIDIEVGTTVKTFTPRTIEKAVYATGWDGSVVLEATDAGVWTVISPASTEILDINTATFEQLVELPMIGPSRAQAILEYRDANGPFDSLDELDAVPGIGPATLNAIAGLVEFS